VLVADHLWTHPQGVGFFIGRAADKLDVKMRATVNSVLEDTDGVEVEWRMHGPPQRERFDACVLAVSAADVLRVHKGLDAGRAHYLEKLDYSSSIVVSLGLAQAPDEAASMVLIPRTTNPSMPVIGLGHNLAPDRVPAGGGILTAFWMREWSQQHWGDDDETLVAHTVAAIRGLLPHWPMNVRASNVARWSPALVASEPGTFTGLQDFTTRMVHDKRIQLAGDYLAQTSVNASVAAGETAAKRLATLLR
jgi:oxygen-dependent protoporphyrinogen oxidase